MVDLSKEKLELFYTRTCELLKVWKARLEEYEITLEGTTILPGYSLDPATPAVIKRFKLCIEELEEILTGKYSTK